MPLFYGLSFFSSELNQQVDIYFFGYFQCVELVGFKVNKDNVLARKGQIQGPWSNNAKSGGDTSMAAKDLYYCGKDKDECRCGSCDGVCGGSSGCPCNSCVELVGFKVSGSGSSKSQKPFGSTLLW